MDRLGGKVALVTGAARGMGEAAARALAAEGAAVVVTDVLDADGRAVADAIGPPAQFVHLDVSAEDQWADVVAETVAAHGRLDVLVNNAGLRVPGRADAMSTEDYMTVVMTNQLSVFFGMRTVAPVMAAGGGGSIVNTGSSMGAMHGRPGSIAYAASKWAIRGMTKSAAIDLAVSGIRVNVIHPGVIDTPMTSVTSGTMATDVLAQLNATIPAGRLGRAAEVAAMVVFLASEDASYCTGAEFTVDGGWGA